MEHLYSLIGRTFILATPNSTKKWKGNSNEDIGLSDYESLDDFISIEEGDLTSIKKEPDSIFHIYFSMSSKVELFSIENGFVICDGLYFNKSWDYSQKLSVKIMANTEIDFIVAGGIINVFDAALEGKALAESSPMAQGIADKASLRLTDGSYSVFRIETQVKVDDQEVLIKGVMVKLLEP